eukprot:1231786-Pleurochrysis_carterae.AAC.6
MFSATCASAARRPKHTRLMCDALSRPRTFVSRSAVTWPSVVRSCRSTSHLFFGLGVPLAVTISVLLAACTLPLTAFATSVTQCIPAPVSPSHIALAQVCIGPDGIDCMMAVA